MLINTSSLRLESLDKIRQERLIDLIPFTKDFVMGGGTALSLQIAHRKSFDFDFFSQQPISKRLSETISRHIIIQEVTVDSTDELSFFDDNRIKYTFLYYYFKPAFDPLVFSNGLRLYPPQEIAVKKAYVIGRRGAYRDYFDLYSILNYNSINLSDLINTAEQIYGPVFNSKLFLEQLVYFDDLTDFEIESISGNTIPEPEVIKSYFQTMVEEYLRTHYS